MPDNRIERFRQVWRDMLQILNGKQVLQVWRQAQPKPYTLNPQQVLQVWRQAQPLKSTHTFYREPIV